jgi:RNA 2',3'-cyclic 3'-phosphodiesterase
VRLFVAVDLDDEARAAIATEQQRLRALAAGESAIRWVRPEQMHMTLVFLGEVDSARAGEVVGAMSRSVEQAAFDLTFAGFGAFPPRGAPRAFWIGVAAGQTELRALQETLSKRIAALGIAIEARQFSPHLTLARWKMSRPADRSRMLTSTHDRIVARTRIDRATLYQSRLSSAGSTYVELARATLSG